MDRKIDEELMEMLGLKETFDRMAKVNRVLWYEHVIRRDDDKVLKKALMLEVNGANKREIEEGQSICGGGKLKRT